MEPLLKEKEKEEPCSRSSTPSSISSAGSWNPGPLARRQRLFITLIAIGLLSISVLSWKTFKSSRSPQPQAFDITLQLQETPYVVAKDGQKIFDWREDSFLPSSPSLAEKAIERICKVAGYAVPTPKQHSHAISVQPKTVSLEGLPDHVRNEEIVFGFTSPYHRAREMCSTWRHFLKDGAQCLIVLPKEEIVYKKEMEFYLQQEGLGCRVETIDLGQYPRYEQRVMNMPRAMRAQEWTDKAGNKIEPKWYVVADDDTQILDMRVLRREMSSRPHSEDHLLCAVTESKQQLGRHGKICYGGGGILMSASLADKMAQRMGECLWWHHWRFGGDEMVTHCAATVLSTADKLIPPSETFEELVGLHRELRLQPRMDIHVSSVGSVLITYWQRSTFQGMVQASSRADCPSSQFITTLAGWRSSLYGTSQIDSKP